MKREDLRAVQKPLKEGYRDVPTTAQITFQAEGTLGDGIACSVATGTAMARAGLHPATGGDGLSVCSGDMLLQALVACAGVTLQAVATSLEIWGQGSVLDDEAGAWDWLRVHPNLLHGRARHHPGDPLRRPLGRPALPGDGTMSSSSSVSVPASLPAVE
jgi:hypothetical protein